MAGELEVELSVDERGLVKVDRLVDTVPDRGPPVKEGSKGEVAEGTDVALGLEVPAGVSNQYELSLSCSKQHKETSSRQSSLLTSSTWRGRGFRRPECHNR